MYVLRTFSDECNMLVLAASGLFKLLSIFTCMSALCSSQSTVIHSGIPM